MLARGLVYAMCSAQQWEWVRTEHPELFERVKAHAAAGRFVPVGGMWVESDTNMVGGEAMVRQFLVGQRWFEEHLGTTCDEVWLPDSFGYTAALPQIVTQAGCRWFLTQKISWNTTNVFPHHTFWWEGIDGTRVFTHFPPVDTYTAELTGRELAHAARNFRDKGAATRSLVPFGHGDGGGGPTREMLGRASRTASLAGSPSVAVETPSAFFEAAEAEYADAPVWAGELYLEIHRGTYTSQAAMKQGNRRSEHLLREAELWCGDRGGPRASATTRPRSWKSSGASCCCTSSTTSCPAPRSRGCTARRGRRTPRWPRGSRRLIERRPRRAGRRRRGRGRVQRGAGRAGRGACPRRESGRGRPKALVANHTARTCWRTSTSASSWTRVASSGACSTRRTTVRCCRPGVRRTCCSCTPTTR